MTTPLLDLDGRVVGRRQEMAGGFGSQIEDLSRYVPEPDAPRLTQDAAKPGAARDVPQAAQSLYGIASREGAPRVRDSGAIGTRASATGRQRGPAHDRAPAADDTPRVSAEIQGLQTPVTSKGKRELIPAREWGHVYIDPDLSRREFEQ